MLGLAVCGGAFSALAQPMAIDGIKAVVSAQVVTETEVEDFSRPAIETLRRQYAPQSDEFQQKLDGVLNDGMQQLVERQLILHSFETDGYKLPDSVIEEIVQALGH